MQDRRTKSEAVLALAQELGVLRVRDLTARDIHPEHLRRLCKQQLGRSPMPEVASRVSDRRRALIQCR